MKAARGFDPPRLAEPPRPWKKVSSSPAARAARTMAVWPFCSAQREAVMPPSLLLSE